MSFTPLIGELILDTTNNGLYIGDGTTVGGRPAGTLVTSDVQDIVSQMLLNGTSRNITFTYDEELGHINASVDVTDFTGTIEAEAFIGSLYASNSLLLVNAETGAINLDSTIKGDVIPASNNLYDIGDNDYRFKNLYLSGSTIKLGAATITASGSAIDLPAGSTLDGDAIGVVVGTEDSTTLSIANGSTLQIRGDEGIQTRIEDGAVYVSADITALHPSLRDDATPAYITFVGNTGAPSYIGTDTDLRYFASSNTLEASNILTNNVTAGNNVTVNNAVIITRNSYSSTISGLLFSQHHNTADSINITLYRSRGTSTAPTTVLNGDDLADISFLGHDGTGQAGGAAISATVDGVVTTGNIPTKLSFTTNNGSTLGVRAELSTTGAWKVDTVQALTTNTALSFGNMVKLPTYADETAANAAVGGSPENGMMYFDTGATRIKVYQNSVWVTIQP